MLPSDSRRGSVMEPIRTYSSSPEVISTRTRKPTRKASEVASARIKKDQLCKKKVPKLSRKPKQSASHTKKSAATRPTPAPSPTQNRFPDHLSSQGTRSQIYFYFFTNDETLGAIPIRFQQCNTASEFFDKAAYALSFTNGNVPERQLLGVSMLIDGMEWPMILPWRDVESFESMNSTLLQVSAEKDGVLNAKIKCILKI